MKAPWNKTKPIRASFGEPITGGTPVGPSFLARRREQWQEQVLDLVTAVPEPSGAVALMERTLDLVVFAISDDEKRIKDADRVEINKMLAKFDRGRAGMLIWTVGECYPMWSVDPESSELMWEVNSPMEVEAEKGKIVKVIGSDDKMRALKGSERLFRMWRPDPKKRFQAWSPHKGQLDVLEAMYYHQLADTAVATSRLAGAGILYIPTDLPNVPVKDGAEPEDGTRQQLQQQLSDAMTRSIKNRDSTEAIVPFVMFGDPSLGENHKPTHILLERTDDAKAWGERMETYVKRYARGVELPIESVEGMGPANHWTAWVIKEDKWRFYVKPLADVLAEALTRNFVRPILQQLGYPQNVWNDVMIEPDGSFLIEKPDKTDAALRLKQMNVISDDAALRETGFDPENDKAPPEEREREQVRLKPTPAQFRDSSPT